MSLTNLPPTERPRERLVDLGEGALSSVELIAIILGSGMRGKSVLALAHELVSCFGSLSKLAEAPLEELYKIKGLGKAKAIQLKAALALATRLSKEVRATQPKVFSPEHVYRLLREELIHSKKEIFGVLLQDAKGHMLKWEVVSIGTLTQTLVHPREVFYPAISHHAASLVLVHNHPSGDPTPSQEDINLTRQLLSVSQALCIPINDHVIICQNHYYSFKNARNLFT